MHPLRKEMSMARGKQFLIFKMLPIDLRPICVSLTRIKKHKAMAICVVAATRLFYSTSSMAEWLRCQAAECKVHSSIPTCGASTLLPTDKLHDSHTNVGLPYMMSAQMEMAWGS